MKRFLTLIIILALLCTMFPVVSFSANAVSNLPQSIYLSQETNVTCTLSSAAMMMRAFMYLYGNSFWGQVTESAIRATAWVENAGLSWYFTYNIGNTSIAVSHEFVSGVTVPYLKRLLDTHPEGIVLYCGKSPHAVFLIDYEGDTFYCADPAGGYSGRRITLASSLLGARYGSQAAVLSNMDAYWYVSSYSVDGRVTPGRPVLNHTINNKEVTFTWDATINTTHYNLWLERKNAAGEWENVEQMFYAESGVSRTLEDGEYRAQLLSYNSNAYEADKSDWVHTWADDVFFSIDGEKTVTYHDAAGNVWLTEENTSGASYSLSTRYPTIPGSYFSGWAYRQGADVYEIRPGEEIKVTDDIALYPVYVTHTDAISGNAVLIYNILDFTETGYEIETTETTVERTVDTSWWSDWSDYTRSKVEASDTVEVKTAPMYRYYYFSCSNCGGREPFYGTSDCGADISSTAGYIGWFTTPYSQCNYQTYSYTSLKYYTTSLGDGQLWNFSSGNLYDTAVGTMDAGSDSLVIDTGYSYRTYIEQSETVEQTVTAYKITKKAVVDEKTPQIFVESKKTVKGSTFTVTVQIKNNPGFCYLEMTPVIAPELTLVKVENGQLISDFTKDKQYVWAADGDVAEDGILMTFTFSVADGVEPGNYKVGFLVRTCGNYDEESVKLGVAAGNIEVIDCVYGDATGDGVVDGFDVIRLKKHLANYDYDTETSTVEIFAGADATGDGIVDGFDVIRLKKYLASYDYETGTSATPLGPQ